MAVEQGVNLFHRTFQYPIRKKQGQPSNQDKLTVNSAYFCLDSRADPAADVWLSHLIVSMDPECFVKLFDLITDCLYLY